ncbi:MAG TPA: hypothetical protein VNW51_10360 [Mucilaginibacter sp.]|jgi:hypothetical protein|nr:hypothetical protein [Mucilaginibacter sp.]
MKKLFVFVCLLFASLAASANKIDELKTDSDVVRFLVSLDKKFTTGKYTPKLIIRPIDSVLADTNCFKRELLSKDWGAKSWQKVDFNNDEHTDLLVTVYWYGYENYAVIDNGGGTFKLISLRYGTEFCELVNVIKHNNQNLIVFHGIETDLLNSFFRPRTDTLIYKYDNFIELNEHPAKYKIDSLILTDGYVRDNRCGGCPSFNMNITNNDSIGFDRYLYGGSTVKTSGGYTVMNHSIKTEPSSKYKLLTKQRKEIFDLLSYIDVKKLKDHYAVPWTDDHTSTISVKFKGGTSKTIVDYGGYGTFGLHALFKKLYAVVRANKPINIKTLVHQADSLKAKSKRKKALQLYDQAITRITSHQDTVAKWEWFRISNAAGELAGKDYMKYAPNKYFADGQKFNEQIANLKEQGVKYFFIYNPIFLGGTGTFYIIDPKKRVQFFPSNNHKLMVWIKNNELYIQEFGDNIYKPLNMNDRKLVNFIEAHYSQFSLQKIPYQHAKYDHREIYEFKFYEADTFNTRTLDAVANLRFPTQNDHIYLAQLLPQMQAEAKMYYARLIE